MGTQASNTGWSFSPLCLTRRPLLVYGVGCGMDVSWDIGMAEKYGADVFLFDPTPKSVQYVQRVVAGYAGEERMESGGRLSFTAEGLAQKPGEITFAMPVDPGHVSMRNVELADEAMRAKGKTVTAKVDSLGNWMSARGHEYLDVFKIDIEGSEYGVLESLVVDDFLPFTQLLVEFHGRFLGEGGDAKKRHDDMLKGLREKGFEVIWEQNAGQEVAFLKVEDLGYCETGDARRVPRKTPGGE